MPLTRDASAEFVCRLTLVAAVAVLVLMTSALAAAWAQGPFGDIHSRAAAGFAGWLQAGAVLPRLGPPHPRRQDRRLGLLGTDGSFVRLRRFPRRRSRPRQGGDFLLPARQRGNLAAWLRALVRLSSAAGRHCCGPRRRRRGADQRHREDDGRDGASHRVRQLRTHHAGRACGSSG